MDKKIVSEYENELLSFSMFPSKDLEAENTQAY